MKTLFAAVMTMLLSSGCSAPDSTASKSEVYAWSADTLDHLVIIYPPSFLGMSKDAMILDNVDFSELNLNYDKNSNMQVALGYADKKFLRDAGVISSVAEYCDLEWDEKQFLPMMQWQRLSVPKSEIYGYQIAVVGYIHGLAQGHTDKWLSENEAECGKVREILKGNLFADKF